MSIANFRQLAAVALLSMTWHLDPPSEALSAQENVEPQDGIEVQTRGPIHEAFAQPVFRRQGASPVIQKTPPQPVEELPPEQRPEGNDVEWIPGYWAWDEDRDGFLWVSGVWRDAPPNHDWVPGYWLQVEGGWQWISGYWAPVTSTQVQLYPPPPDPIEEAQPTAPNDDSVFIPGCWVYRETRYFWRPGFWVANRPGWVWVSAGYYWTPGGYYFADGYWDYDLEHRGLCFAPVYIEPRVYARPGWYYRPRYAILPNVLLTSLFVHSRWNHYAFGDYYDPAYATRGYQPWMNFRVGDRFANPLFGYYRWRHRDDARWEDNLRSTFAARQKDPQARPPRTFALQQKANANLVTPLAQVATTKDASVRLQPVAKDQMRQVEIQSNRVRQAVQQRQKLEANVGRMTQSPVNINLPVRTDGAKKLPAGKAPPPPPTVPTVTQQTPVQPQTPPTGKPPVPPDPPGTKPSPPAPPQVKPMPPTPPNVKPTPPTGKPVPPDPPGTKPTPPAPPQVKPTPPQVKPTPPTPPQVKPAPPTPPQVKPTPPTPPQVSPPRPLPNVTPPAPPKPPSPKPPEAKPTPPPPVPPPPAAQPQAVKPVPPRPAEEKKKEEKKKG